MAEAPRKVHHKVKENLPNKVLKIKENLPSSNLKSDDLKFVAELVAYIGCINGRNKLQISIHDTFATRYKVIIAQMCQINMDDVRQIEMMNSRVKNIVIDLSRGYLIVESWKIGKETTKEKAKKRRRDNDQYVDIPNSFNLKSVQKNDLRQIEGILRLFLNAVDLEFNIELKQTENTYNLLLSRLENVEITKVDTVLNAFKAFINQIIIDFPAKKLRLSIRKSDSPLEGIAPFRRKMKIRRS